jgi:ABC-2 type transport system permease protein
MADMLASAGGSSVVDSYLSTSLMILALVAACAALQCSLRVRSEETDGRAGAVLATPTSRSAWLQSYVVTAFVGSALVMVAGAFGLGAAYGVVIGDLGQAPRLMAASLLYVPAIWLIASIAIALFGLAPRAAQVAWAGIAVAFVIAMFGTLLDLPQWALDLSPFQHVPQAPAAAVSALPIIVLSVLAIVVTSAGFFGFARRDTTG